MSYEDKIKQGSSAVKQVIFTNDPGDGWAATEAVLYAVDVNALVADLREHHWKLKGDVTTRTFQRHHSVDPPCDTCALLAEWSDA